MEYHDPSGVFPIVSRDLANRLPLRNLNWQSPPRPLRQIRSLHVDFVPDKATQSILKPQLTRTDSNGPDSLEIVRSGANNAKERRHQIPGFKTSPYLKIYILRCDDKEAYKEHDRQKIREWLKGSAVPEGKRADHDACEWLILHVVIPDTVAASEPRWRESTRDPDELKERKGGTKWPGQSGRTVLDRLRADFNETGKMAKDRVTQIRLVKGQMPADLIPTPAAATTLEESAQERENAWNDLVSKFKTLILGPFDRRVRQYEADIAEQEARRSLPGFNFCTFFIHKEGLAKALESIGLVEDALAIYDELSLGLETVCREIAEGKASGTATSFAAYTEDLEDRISGAPGMQTNGNDDLMTNDAAHLFSKDYRERILRSDISVFDFMCYLYHRQKALILRLANAKSSRVELGAISGRDGGEDLVLTSEVCWRTSTFVHSAARALRHDYLSRKAANELSTPDSEVDIIVCAWAWAVAGQVLEQTAAPALLDVTQHDDPQTATVPNEKPKRHDLSIGLGANSHPQRSASLPGPKHDSLEPLNPLTRPKTQGDRPPSRSGLQPNKPIGLPGQAELATYRAELVMMRRKMLEQLAAHRSWYAGWSFAKRADRSDVNDVKTDIASEPSDADAFSRLPMGPTLKNALESEESFRNNYEDLTTFAIQHYLAATQRKNAERLIGDLAVLKCQQNDNAAAAAYFQRILPISDSDSWESVDLEVLSTYCSCLKDLERREEYVRVALALITKSISRRKGRGSWRANTSNASGKKVICTTKLWLDAIAASSGFQEEDAHPIRRFFEDVHLCQEVVHESADGFGLSLNLTHVLDSDIEFDQAFVRLVGVHDSTLVVSATSDGPIRLVPGKNQVDLKSTVVSYGAFLIEKVVLCAQKLRFVEELQPEPTPTPLGFTGVQPPTVTVTDPSKAPPFVFLYPAEHAFVAEIKRSRNVHIDKPRHLQVSLSAGQSTVDTLEVRLKPTSAGLRLYVADATVEGLDPVPSYNSKPGHIILGSLASNAAAQVSIPYTVEHANRNIAVRLEIRYQTDQGTFTFLHTATLANELTLDVDVNDLFHIDTLYSNFTVRTTTKTPFSVLDAELSDSPVYAVESPPILPLPVNVYKSQPMNLVYKITRKSVSDREVLKRDAALALDVTYLPTDELLLHSLGAKFFEDLKHSMFVALHRLLSPLLLERFRQSVQSADLETAAIIGEIKLPDFDTIGWDELTRTLPSQTRSRLVPWLWRWHEENTVLTAARDAEARTVAQHITISVDVPNVDVVFSASLRLPQLRPTVGSHPVMIKLGQPIHATLQIRSTKQWSAKSMFPSVPSVRIQGNSQAQQMFVLDVGAAADTWLVGGQRRHHFTLQGDETQTIDVLLVPLRLGRHGLPLIEVQQPSSDEDGSTVAGSISCETHYESAGKLVHVVRDARTSTVDIPEATVLGNQMVSRPGTASTNQV